MRLSVIIPCYNEARNLPLLINRCARLEEAKNIEVILVDNGSSDNSPQIMSELIKKYNHIRFIRVEHNKGYGHGILCGLENAKGEILSWTHADMQTDPLDVLEGLSIFDRHGLDIFVKGKRYGRPVLDVMFTKGMSIFETILMGTTMSDINAQPTMFSSSFFKSWNKPPNDFALDLFAFYQAKNASLPVYRMPVKFGERAYGISHWNVDWISKLKFIQRTIKYSLDLKKRLK